LVLNLFHFSWFGLNEGIKNFKLKGVTKMKLKQLLLLAALVMPFSVGAATIQFSTLTTPGVNITDYSESGYTLDGRVKTSPNTVSNADGGFVGVNFGDTIVLTADDSSLFNVSSIDLAPWSSTTSVYFEGVTGSGSTVQQVVSVSGLFGTFILSGFNNLISFSFDDNGASGSFYVDNIVLSPSAVPLPAAVWLFGPALLGLMGFRRKAVDTAAA